MKRFGIIAAIGCAFALCLALAGCGGGSSSGAAADDAVAAKAAFAGTWDLVGLTEGGEETSADDLDMLKQLGLEVYLNLNEDGTGELVLFGESMDGTWEASSTTEGTLTMEGQAVAMTIDNGDLKMTQDDSSLTFQKGEPRTGASASDSAASADSSASADAAADSADDEASDEEASDEAA